jgi:hypothetical protein
LANSCKFHVFLDIISSMPIDTGKSYTRLIAWRHDRPRVKGRLPEIRIRALSGFGLEDGVVEKRPASGDEGGGRTHR